jgi:hypothetical protein
MLKLIEYLLLLLISFSEIKIVAFILLNIQWENKVLHEK